MTKLKKKILFYSGLYFYDVYYSTSLLSANTRSDKTRGGFSVTDWR